MKSLPAALRESATTTLKKGRFLAPPRERRITTMMNDRNGKGRDFTRAYLIFPRQRQQASPFFGAAQLLFLHLRGLRRLSELGRQLVDHRRYPAHLAHLADLLLEVLQVEALALSRLLREFLRVLDVDRLARLFDEREHVAHAEDARGHALGVKGLQAVRLLAHAGELDRLSRDLPHRQGRPAAPVTVHLGEH